MSGNPAQPAPGTRLCALADLGDPGALGFMFRAGDMLFLGFLIRAGVAVAGYVDRCPHAGMPLALIPGRYLDRTGEAIVCASHGALFRLADGLCISGPCAGRSLSPWAVRVEGDEVVTG